MALCRYMDISNMQLDVKPSERTHRACHRHNVIIIICQRTGAGSRGLVSHSSYGDNYFTVVNYRFPRRFNRSCIRSIVVNISAFLSTALITVSLQHNLLTRSPTSIIETFPYDVTVVASNEAPDSVSNFCTIFEDSMRL